MKTDIHPTTYTATITCACGSSFATISTKESIQVEICSQCHPFFTGKQKIVDSARRVEKFQEREQKHGDVKKERKYRSKKEKHAARQQKKAKKTKAAKSDAKAALKAAKAALSDD